MIRLLSLLLLTVLVVSATETSEKSSRFLLEASKFFRRGYYEVRAPAPAPAALPPPSDGTRWAVLIAGSNGWGNYRHQADVCHAYQILRKGGLKDENIIVMMYDDIASNEMNPRPGIIINSPNGDDVYHGVPKDYTGENVNANNFLNVILGNKSALTGGSGKVVDSGPNDHIFIYYTDHGGPLVLGMPNGVLYANDLLNTLQKKYASGTYKTLVFYIEACESGSIFSGHLPENYNIYATTASNPNESSWGYYCPHFGQSPPPPKEYDTCLGDLYSIAWMEDADKHDLFNETLEVQFERVRRRTANYSHVMQYGNLELSGEELSVYMGPKNADVGSVEELPSLAVPQRDAELVHYWEKFRRAPEDSRQRVEAQKQIVAELTHRMFIDNSVETIGKILFGTEKGNEVLKTVRPESQPHVDDWDCFQNLMKTFEAKCGQLSQYAMKHSRAIANICNAGIKEEQMAEAASLACFSRA